MGLGVRGEWYGMNRGYPLRCLWEVDTQYYTYNTLVMQYKL